MMLCVVVLVMCGVVLMLCVVVWWGVVRAGFNWVGIRCGVRWDRVGEWGCWLVLRGVGMVG